MKPLSQPENPLVALTGRRRLLGWLVLPLGTALTGFAAGARADESPLDTAYERVAEAIEALKAPGDEPLTGSRRKAVELLVRAQSEILKARQSTKPAKPAP